MPNLDVLQEALDVRTLSIAMSQAGVADPTISATFENTLGYNKTKPTLARTGVGVYTITAVGYFNGTLFIRALAFNSGSAFYAKLEKTSSDVLTLTTFNAAGAAVDMAGTIYIWVEMWDQ